MDTIQHIASTLLRGWLPGVILVWGSVALGLCLLPRRWRTLPSPWPVCIAAALGSQIVGIVTLGLAARGLVGPLALSVVLVAPLLVCCWLARRRRRTDVSSGLGAWWKEPLPYRLMLLMCAACYVLMFVIASTPPSKHDDLWYHLIPAKRTLVEGIARFYPSPFLLTAPQQSYEFSFIPLLRFGSPSAALAAGVMWSLVFAWCFWERARRRSVKRAAIGTTILVCAFSNLVWWTSASSAALAAFVATFLVLWIVEREDLRSGLRTWEYFAVLGILSAALSVAKLSFLAPVSLLLCAAWYDEMRSHPSWRTFLTVTFATGVPLMLLYGPWLWWSYAGSGNPFGIALAGMFGRTVFDPSRLHDTLERARELNQYRIPGLDVQPAVLRPVGGIIGFVRESLSLKQTHLAHLGVALIGGPLALVMRRQWAVLLAALAGSFLLGVIVTHDLRFHSIVIYGFLLVAVLWWNLPRSPASTRIVPWVVVGLTLPTLAAGVYYSATFIRNAVGRQTNEEFLTRYTGMYTAIEWCNAHLPQTARVCLDVHALPRLFYFDRIALPPEHQTKQEVADGLDLQAYMRRNGLSYLVSTHIDHASSGRFVLMQRFDHCILEGLRSPGATPVEGTVYVYRLTGDGVTPESDRDSRR